MEKYKPVFGYRLKPNPSNKEFIKHPVYTTFSQMVVTHHQNVLNLCPPPLVRFCPEACRLVYERNLCLPDVEDIN